METIFYWFTGTQGNSCELCEDGFFVNSTTRKCQRCTCNGNIDENAIGNCDTIDGRCLRCMYNTTGKSCEKCAHGYWGNALTSLKCHACDCFKAGTNVDDSQCALNDGQCKCKPHVIGRQCDQCEESYWNITSGKGCAECKCDPLGSYNLTCSPLSGQCFCKPGVIGLRCDKCAINHFDFTDMGCKRCNCDEFGSESLQCDDFGRCKCKSNIVGMKCDKCEENRYNFTRGCLKCEDCYTLVEREVHSLRGKAKDISLALNDRTSQQNQVARKTNDNLSGKLQNLKNLVNQMHKTFYDGPENINYTESVRSLSENLKSLNNEYKSKERDYENHMKQFEDLERLNSIIGNAELELSGVKLILDNAEVRIKEKAAAQPLTTEKSRIQTLAQVARDASEHNTKVADDYARQFGILMESLKTIISRISFVPERLKNANQVISSKSYQASLEFPDERILALNEDIAVAKEKLRIKSDTTKSLLDRLQSTTVYNSSDDVDVVSIESFAASINDKVDLIVIRRLANNFRIGCLYVFMFNKGASLKTQIDMLSKNINQFVTFDIANATLFSRNIMISVQLKQQVRYF
jgi:laminin gamma 1